ncbi:DNA ligase D [Cupriavidus plantarum]|uniref:DNA ligase D n=1 Tax=Cupriavidus plantarum TaxID=942865 RepID=UPI0015C8E575|nr:DNA ligase D [Cupriavidus plantarum]NYI02726.1 bifunctional non-homologous end joining protein LigD [Cupriavidus plantarum]
MASRTRSLERYDAKRDFTATPEPSGRAKRARRSPKALSFVIQKHWARRLHYDFRLELDGVLVSWAVPKGPSFDPAEKRIAVHVEDHPLGYAGFEGEIPKGNYGAGSVIVWDRGIWTPVGDPREGLASGKILFDLQGHKLAGRWELVRIAKPGDRSEQWILFKKRDAWARPLAEFDVLNAMPDSVSGEPETVAKHANEASQQSVAVEEAPKASLPPKLSPQLATLSPTVPIGPDWIIETKFDGYRLLARIQKGTVKLFTRNGHDWTSKFRTLVQQLAQLGVDEAWLDGEIVVLRDDLPDFNALQNAISADRNDEIVYFLFDIPYWNGRDLRGLRLDARRAHLAALLRDSPDRLRFSDAFDAPAPQLFKAACDLKLEGLMFKRADAPYTSARTATWLKAKCKLRQEFAVGGYAERGGAGNEVGKLYLGVYEGRKLRYVGGVGTGWDSATAAQLRRQLDAHQIDDMPFDIYTKAKRWGQGSDGPVHWVQPKMVVEVEFSEWTPEGHVRHASFKGVRTDIAASSVRQEAVQTVVAPQGVTSVKVTNPERIIDPSTGITKLELVRYYESIADRMLPHLKNRPLSLVRAPDGVAKTTFFQKHADTAMPGLTELDPDLWPGHSALLAANSADAIVAAAQMNVIEFHTWNSVAKKIDIPDRFILDLDPGEGLPWQRMQEAALLVKTLLDELGLRSWLKTSGGKGLHVVVPLSGKQTYEVVKDFSRAVTQHLAATLPDRFTSRSGPANRVGKIFVDYLRNGHAQTTAAAFSARSRPGLGVSMPITWDELSDIKSGDAWTVRTAREYLSFQSGDPWKDYWSARQTLSQPSKRLGLT